MRPRIGGLTIVILSLALSAVAQVAGSGGSNFIPRWTNTTTLGNSILFQTGGMVGLGTTTPSATFTVVGQNGNNSSLTSISAPTALQVMGGVGATKKGSNGGFVAGAGGL